jgi:predicted Na+-dependent transporter
MKTNRYLLPHVWKKVGLWLLVPLVFCLVWENILPAWIWNIYYTLLPVGFTIALLLIGFAREKIEDEYIMKLRGDSLIIAVVAHYIVVIIGSLLYYNFKYFGFLAYNMFTVLLLYVVIFNVKLYRLRHEK